ncbi:alpha/beta hydrolase [Candidatus Parcubacteria bacterium]|nr:alpha/beta hydrolase [Candidatus Parcubacteria bacterium]
MIKKIILDIVIIILSVYVFVIFYMFINQESYLFFSSKEYIVPPSNLGVEEVWLETNDGEKLHAWWLENKKDSKTVIFFHGNAGNISDRVSQVEIFKKLNLNCLMVDYRGYGKSSGQIKKEKDIYLDGLAAWNYVIKEQGKQIKDIIIWGRSLGGAVAIDLAQEKDVFAVIVESTFYSVIDMAKKHHWFLPVGLIAKYKFLSNDKIKNIKAQIMVVHSRDDEIIPFEQGERLFYNANEPKVFLEIAGGHNTGVFNSYDKYVEEINKFLNKK